jgi:hypothetical protein
MPDLGTRRWQALGRVTQTVLCLGRRPMAPAPAGQDPKDLLPAPLPVTYLSTSAIYPQMAEA